MMLGHVSPACKMRRREVVALCRCLVAPPKIFLWIFDFWFGANIWTNLLPRELRFLSFVCGCALCAKVVKAKQHLQCCHFKISRFSLSTCA